MTLDSSLNKEQLDAVYTTEGPVLVLAGAGSGKTRVVTYRIAHLIQKGVSPFSILALTFTNKAAQEMNERIRHLTNHYILICTFHSLGARILREFADRLGYQSNFTIYDTQDTEKLMKVCLAEVPGAEGSDVKSLLQAISEMKNALGNDEEISIKLDSSLRHIFVPLYRHYQKKLLESNAVDFDDLLRLPVKLLRENPDILELLQQRWSHLLVDEYQDTNAAQYTLVRLLVASHHNLCVVGDPDQSIYSWRGANIENILGFEDDFPQAKVIRLEQNYRSRTNILNGANSLIRFNAARQEKSLWSDKGPGEKIQHFTADTEKSEADFVANKIRYYYETYDIPLKNMAVFYRTNAQSRPFEDKFLSYRLPFVIVGGISFYQRKEIKDILAFLRMSLSPNDYVCFERTINLPKRGIGETTLDKLRIGASQETLPLLDYCLHLIEEKPLHFPTKLSTKQKEGLKSYLNMIGEIQSISKECSLPQVVKSTIERSGYLNHLMNDPDTLQERTENLNSLISKAIEWDQATGNPTLEGFLQELTLKTTLDESNTADDKVSLMTIHNSKGLEFDVVFLVGLEEDLFPHANSRDSLTALEEERRLCYVGMTRAREFLYLCDCRIRLLWGTTRSQRPSRFIKEISSEYIEKIRPSYSVRPHEGVKKRMERWDPFDSKETEQEPFMDEMEVKVEKESLSQGTTIFHPSFGIGVITQVYETSQGLTYKILFNNDQRERSLVAKLAPLKKL